MLHFQIEEAHFKYLALQKGNLSDYLFDRNFWQAEYDKDIENTLQNIAEFIDPETDRILDVGSGLGGIDAALNRLLGGKTSITLLDGFNSPAEVKKHNIPFSDFHVAKDFLQKNGVKKVGRVKIQDALDYPDFKDQTELSKHYLRVNPFDLIISFQAWCFHFPPQDYIGFVRDHVVRGKTTLVLDVRNEKPDWVLQLVKNFGPFEVIFKKPKYTRMVFKPQ